MIDKVLADGHRTARYTAVSLAGTLLTQFLLIVAQHGLGLRAVAANVTACSLAAVPVFLLNRQWVWGITGPSSIRREVVPFWGFTLAGLLLSTALVGVVSQLTAAPVAVSGANIAGFAVLWVVKFAVLDEVVFAQGPSAARALRGVAASR